MTLPWDRVPRGARHPISAIADRIADVFVGMGYEVAEGPELEAEWFNFDALNFGKDHPARPMDDTFYVAPGRRPGAAHPHVARAGARAAATGASGVHRASGSDVPRRRAGLHAHSRVPPGRGPRRGQGTDDGPSQRHIRRVREAMFGEESSIRLRPHFFPFTEPSAEVDVWFPEKKGGPGWVEWGGCGMVNPNVLRACGVDPEVYSGFAFGMGSSGRSCSATASRTCATWWRATSASPCHSERRRERHASPRQLAEANTSDSARRHPDDIADAFVRLASRSRASSRSVAITGPLVIGRVVEIEELTEFKKPIRYCRVDVGAPTDVDGGEIDPTRPPTNGIICGAHELRRGRPGGRRAARRRVAR